MANSQIVTQNELTDIINAIVSNADNVDTIEQVLPKIIDTVKKMANSASSIKGGVESIKKVVRYVHAYRDVVVNVVGALCKDLPGEGKTLSDVLGRIEEPDAYDKNSTVVKWTVIEASQQIPKIIDSTFKIFESISGFKLGFKAMLNFKRNVMIFKHMIQSALILFVNVLSEIVNDKNIDVILKKMIKQPDTIDEHFDNKYDYDNQGVKRLIGEIKDKKTVQGEFGLLDIFDKMFSVMSLLNALKLPTFVVFKVKMMRLKYQLSDMIATVVNTFDELDKKKENKLFDKIQWMSRLVVGDGTDSSGAKNGDMIGLYQMAVHINLLIEQLTTIKLTKKRTKKLKDVFVSFKNVLRALVIAIDDDDFIKLGSKTFSERISRVSETTKSFIDIIASLQDVIKGILFLKAFKKPIISSIETIALIVITINEKFKDLELGDTDILNSIEPIINALVTISSKVIILGLLAIPARIGLGLTKWLVLAITSKLLPAIRLFAKMSKNIQPVAVRGFMAFEKIIMCMLMATLTIAAFVVFASKINIVQLGVAMLLIFGAFVLMVGVMYVTSKLLEFLTKKSVPNMMSFMLNTILIFGSLIVAGLTIVAASYMADYIVNTDTIGKITLMLLGMIALTGAVMLLGFGLSLLTPVVAPIMLGFGQIVVIFGMILGIGVMINMLADKTLKIGDKNNPEPGTARYVINQIFEFVSDLRSLLRDDNDKNIFGKGRRKFKRGEWKRDKKMLRQVDQCVREIVDIANRLNYLQTVKIDIEKIIGTTKEVNGKIEITEGSVGKIFTCVNKINAALISFNKDTDNSDKNDYDRRQRQTKRRMRRNKKVLSKVDKVINKIADITESLISIKNFVLTTEEEKKLLGAGGSIEKIFECVNKVDEKIRVFNGLNITLADPNDPIASTNGIFDRWRERVAARKQKREYRHNAKTMTKVEGILISTGEIVNVLKEIATFEVDTNTIDTKLTNIFECVDKVTERIKNTQADIPNANQLEKIAPLANYIESLGNGFKNIGDADASKVEKNLGNYSSFIDSINTVEVTKLETATNMFKQMSEFSNSIKGDFKDLAESLAEKLLPVLEDLKDIMEKVPEKLDTGFQNTAASIGATTAPATKENIEAQITRENPNLSKEDIDTIVANRLNENAKANINGVAAKLDELMDLLRGTNTGPIKVAIGN